VKLILIQVRSWAYLFSFLTWTIAVSISCLPALLKRRWALVIARMWVRGVMNLAKTVAGIDCLTLGREHVPQGACVIAAQHQSSYETYRLFLEVDQPVFILKRELTLIPIIGWFMSRIGLIGIDRSAGAGAMRKVLRETQAALDAGRQVIIFPEGTRTEPGVVKPYRPGIAALYAHCSVPIIPMALNSGYFWGKTRILKQPGTIVFHFLPPLTPGQDKDTMLKDLRARIDSAASEMPQI
jgi:1-acyl-sn-glycerol-3-phosphate acyltransferase